MTSMTPLAFELGEAIEREGDVAAAPPVGVLEASDWSEVFDRIACLCAGKKFAKRLGSRGAAELDAAAALLRAAAAAEPLAAEVVDEVIRVRSRRILSLEEIRLRCNSAFFSSATS
jgi:hypothetical protein